MLVRITLIGMMKIMEALKYKWMIAVFPNTRTNGALIVMQRNTQMVFALLLQIISLTIPHHLQLLQI